MVLLNHISNMRESIIRLVVAMLWLAWLVYWGFSARDVKPTRRREPVRSQLLHRVPLLLAAICLAAPRWVPRALTRRFLPASDAPLLAGVVLLAAGLGFTIWARRHLGRNWSGSVVVKEGHTLVRSGPYKRVRHPIYSGILLAFLGTALTIGEWRGIVALVLVTVSFVQKSRTEEAWMREVFPEYQQYQRETAAIIPLIY